MRSDPTTQDYTQCKKKQRVKPTSGRGAFSAFGFGSSVLELALVGAGVGAVVGAGIGSSCIPPGFSLGFAFILRCSFLAGAAGVAVFGIIDAVLDVVDDDAAVAPFPCAWPSSMPCFFSLLPPLCRLTPTGLPAVWRWRGL